VKQAIARAIELIAVVVVLTYVAPWLQRTFPDTPQLLAEVCVVVTTAFLYEILLFLFFIPPAITLTWRDGLNPNPLTRVTLPGSVLAGGSAYLEVGIRRVRGSLGGAFLLWLLRGRGLTLVVKFATAPVEPVVDLSRPITQGQAVARTVASWERPAGRRGRRPSWRDGSRVEIDLAHEPEDEIWAWARLLIQPVRAGLTVTNETFSIRARAYAHGRWSLCARVIRTPSSASAIEIYR
jgi:hypothetical protein